MRSFSSTTKCLIIAEADQRRRPCDLLQNHVLRITILGHVIVYTLETIQTNVREHEIQVSLRKLRETLYAVEPEEDRVIGTGVQGEDGDVRWTREWQSQGGGISGGKLP